MNREEMKNLPLNEAEIEQVSSGNDDIPLTLHHWPFSTAKCPRCTYSKYVLPETDPGVCPNCHVPLTLKG